MADNFTKNNSSHGNFTFDDYFYIYERVSITSAVILSILALLTVIANGISLYAIFKDPLRCFRNPFAVYITGILVSDFLTGLVVEPVFVALYTLWMVEIDAASYLKLIHSVQILSAVTINTSFLTVLALAVTQLIALRWPSAFRNYVTTSTATIGLIFIWVYAIIFAVIPEMGPIKQDIYFIADLILHQLLISVILVIVYIVIYFSFVRAMRRHQSATEAPENENENQGSYDGEQSKPANEKIEKDFLVGSFIVIAVLIITVWPFTIAWFIMMFRSEERENEDTFLKDYIALIVSDDILFLKFFLDPLIFVWRLPKYRKAISIVLAPARVRLFSIFGGSSLPNANYHRPDGEDSGEDRLITDREWSVGVLEIKDEDQA